MFGASFTPWPGPFSHSDVPSMQAPDFVWADNSSQQLGVMIRSLSRGFWVWSSTVPSWTTPFNFTDHVKPATREADPFHDIQVCQYVIVPGAAQVPDATIWGGMLTLVSGSPPRFTVTGPWTTTLYSFNFSGAATFTSNGW